MSIVDRINLNMLLSCFQINIEALMNNNMGKLCSKHGQLTIEQTYFRKDPSRSPECRLCIKDNQKRGYVKHRNKRLQDAAEYRENHKEYLAEWARKDRKSNPEKYKEQAKVGYKGHPYTKRMREVLRVRGLTIEVYQSMVDSHNNLCAICKQPETRKSPKSDGILRLSIDHCHQTGKTRGLLCHNCNTGIGKFKDDIELMHLAIMYLEKHQAVK